MVLNTRGEKMEEEKKEGEGACQSHVAVHPVGLVTRVLHPNQSLIRVPAALGLHRHAKDRWNIRLGVQEPFSQCFQIFCVSVAVPSPGQKPSAAEPSPGQGSRVAGPGKC